MLRPKKTEAIVTSLEVSENLPSARELVPVTTNVLDVQQLDALEDIQWIDVTEKEDEYQIAVPASSPFSMHAYIHSPEGKAELERIVALAPVEAQYHVREFLKAMDEFYYPDPVTYLPNKKHEQQVAVSHFQRLLEAHQNARHVKVVETTREEEA